MQVPPLPSVGPVNDHQRKFRLLFWIQTRRTVFFFFFFWLEKLTFFIISGLCCAQKKIKIDLSLSLQPPLPPLPPPAHAHTLAHTRAHTHKIVQIYRFLKGHFSSSLQSCSHRLALCALSNMAQAVMN